MATMTLPVPGALTWRLEATAGYSRERCLDHAQHLASNTGCTIVVSFSQAFGKIEAITVTPQGAKKE